MNKNFSLYDFLIYIFLPFGQLFARINLLNSSVDKSWLLLFCFIPFIVIPIFPILFNMEITFTIFFILVIITNIISLLFIEYGKIDISNTNEKTSIDKYVLLPIIIKVLIAILIIAGFKNDNTNEKIIKNIIIFVSILYSLYLRQREKCNSTKLFTILIDAIFIYSMSDISVDIFNKIKLNNTLQFPTDLNSNLLFSIIGLFISHNFINYFNDNDLTNYCSGKNNFLNFCPDDLHFNKVRIFAMMIFVLYYNNTYTICKS